MKASEKAYPPNIQCAFLTSTLKQKGYVCAVLTELLCVKKGTCKFFKPREDKHEFSR